MKRTVEMVHSNIHGEESKDDNSQRYQTIKVAGEIEDKREQAEKDIRQSNNKLKNQWK